MKSRSLGKIIFTLLFFLPSLCFAQLWPHFKTFGFDYGYPRDTEQLQWLATHHDVLVGIGEWQTKKISEAQYDTLKAANPNVILIPYVVFQAFTFLPMQDFMVSWAKQNSYNPEDLYLHYYYDTVVKTRVKVVKTSGTGTPSDRVCDVNGVLLADGLSSNYYIALGYGGGKAKTIEEARIFQYWNAGFEPRMNHLSAAWKGAYKAYILDVITAEGTTNKYADGVMLDTYQGAFDVVGYLPNMHHMIEVRNAGYTTDDKTAKAWYAEQVALYVGDLREYLKSKTGKSMIYIIPNFGELSYTYNTYKFGCEDQFAANKLNAGTIEYVASPSKNYYVIRDYFQKHYDAGAQNDFFFFNHLDTAWYHYGKTPPIGGKQFMIGSLYLFNSPTTFSAIHYGTASKYGPDPTYADSHWDKMMEFDIGTPVVRGENDFWGVPNTDRAFLVETEAPGSWNATLNRTDPRGRYVLAREYTKGLVIVRYEYSNNTTLSELGTEPRTYQLGGEYRRLLEDNTFGPVVTEITIGLSEGAILIKKEYAKTPWQGPVIDQNKTTLPLLTQ
ncbi:hypothetical protein ACUUL3_02315 [Thiovibrio sp. JS02]